MTEAENKSLWNRSSNKIIDHSTRFTNDRRKGEITVTFERGLQRATELYSEGVFITLTTNPALHKSLWHANKHFSEAWNKFLSLLNSRNEGTDRLKYIAIYEMQKNGFIHCHACFFGVRSLGSIDPLKEDWIKCGQGEIVLSYGIRKNGETWVWDRESPANVQGRNPVECLRKHLLKSLYVNQNFGLYWTMNKRFCSMSRVFNEHAPAVTVS